MGALLIPILQSVLTLGVLGISAWNSYQHVKTRAVLNDLKVYMHENFVTKDEAAASARQLNESAYRMFQPRRNNDGRRSD